MAKSAVAAPAAPQPEKKKRGNYKKVECPHCHKYVGNLGNHIKLAHPTEAENNPVPEPEPTREEFLGIPTQAKPPAPVKTQKTYVHQDCNAEVRYGEENCWNCGARLSWEGIE